VREETGLYPLERGMQMSINHVAWRFRCCSVAVVAKTAYLSPTRRDFPLPAAGGYLPACLLLRQNFHRAVICHYFLPLLYLA